MALVGGCKRSGGGVLGAAAPGGGDARRQRRQGLAESIFSAQALECL